MCIRDSSYIRGAVDPDSNATDVGGIIGFAFALTFRGTRSTITNTYNIAIIGGGDGYGWYGRNYHYLSTPAVINTYYLSDASEARNSSTQRTNAELKAGLPTAADADNPIYVDWDDEDIWDFVTTNEYPILR